MVRAAGIEPARPFGLRIFIPLRLSPPSQRGDVCGLDYPFTVAFAVGAARLVSTPSRFRAWLGIAIAGFPEFEQFCTSSFQEGTQVSLSPLRLPISPRPHTFYRYINQMANCQGKNSGKAAL